MSRAIAGLEFRERMAGPFALGETDPQRGANTGRATGGVLTLRACVRIPDLAHFVADTAHAASLEGVVLCPTLGGEAHTSKGTVGLFTPTSDRDVKVMTYRAAFSMGDEVYYLDGVKTVRRAWMFAGWRATTTLECRVHAGPGPEGPVVGAGILRLSPLDFAAQLTSFRSRGVRSVFGRLGAFGTFLRFFAGELIDSYVWRSARP